VDEQDTSTEGGSPFPVLDEVEARLLGCLVEKQATTPETYPLTANAAQVACNQKSNREPIMNLEPGAVGNALRRLEDKHLVKVTHSPRALRYEHCFEQIYGVTQRQRAVLCALLLRGPQTLNEIYTRTDKLAQFAGGSEVQDTLERLAERTHPLVVRLQRASGQREQRYMHLLCGPVTDSAPPERDQPDTREHEGGDLPERVSALEQEVAALRAELAALRDHPA
jgi:uncharacterized protein YceH (UPF0502 family)